MPDPALLALKARLPRTWPAFFERYGTFTASQVAGIPALLDGANVMLCAPTASGKTAAVLAPLIERYCPLTRPPGRPLLLYLTPTRALANDLHARLAAPLESIGLSLGIKTSDSAFRPQRPPDLLITTPESTDSLLASQARLLIHLRAIVIDELHLFDGTPRGDQLRVVLNRLRRVRSYAAEQGDAPDAAIQYAALSATIAAPETAVARYFADARVIEIPGGRALKPELIELGGDSEAALAKYLATFRARGWRKALVFCNSRAEVEAYAAATLPSSPFGSAVFTHYSNIEPERRREIERQFASVEAAICFSSSTLELGIDIGQIDVVILIGPPGSPAAFVQRAGRGGRRQSTTRVACCYRNPLEHLLFTTLIANEQHMTSAGPLVENETRHTFRPAVAIQQIFSLLKQSPTAAVRPAELANLFAGMLTRQDLEAILGSLSRRGYLGSGRPGEWRAGPRLNKLIDEQISAQPGLSIYTNIQTSPARMIDIRDQHTGQTVAKVDALWLDRDVLTLEGRPFSVQWADGEALWVSSYQGQIPAAQPIYRSSSQVLSYELARLLPEQLGLPPGTAPFIATPPGWRWFHWLGDLYGRAALDLLRYRVPAQESGPPGLCLALPDEPRAPPAWAAEQVIRYLNDTYHRLEHLLNLGPFQQLLPVALRRRSVVEQFDVPRFLAAVAALRPVVAPEGLGEDLERLLPGVGE